MEPTETTSTAEPGRITSLARDAIARRPLPPAAEASLARAVDRLAEAMTLSDDEARATKT